jgi:flagellar biosynthesis GTPase FlhF
MKKDKGSSLKDRLRKSYESRDKGGNSRPSAMDWKKVENVKFFKPKEGKNNINIIPYIVKTKNDPLVHSGDAKVGDESYMLDVYMHRNIGPTQAEVLCLKSNYGKPCPICKQAQEFKDAGKKDEASALWPKRQCFYNVIDVKNPEAGIQVFGISHFLFEKELIEEARAAADDGDIVDFVDIDDGKSVSFRAVETSSPIGGKNVTFFEYKSFSFSERDEPLDPDLVKEAVSFDALLKVQTPAEMEKVIFGDDDEEEAEEEEADDDDDEKEEEEPVKKAKAPVKKAPAKKVVEEDDEEEEEPDADDEEADEEEEDEPPAKPVKKAPAKAPAKEEKPAKKGSSNPCPSGHKYGLDNDKHDECEDCDSWADCLKEKNRLKKAK